METFNVSVTETLSRLLKIKAATYEGAIAEAMYLWKSGDCVLDSDDFQDVKFANEE